MVYWWEEGKEVGGGGNEPPGGGDGFWFSFPGGSKKTAYFSDLPLNSLDTLIKYSPTQIFTISTNSPRAKKYIFVVCSR